MLLWCCFFVVVVCLERWFFLFRHHTWRALTEWFSHQMAVRTGGSLMARDRFWQPLTSTNRVHDCTMYDTRHWIRFEPSLRSWLLLSLHEFALSEWLWSPLLFACEIGSQQPTVMRDVVKISTMRSQQRSYYSQLGLTTIQFHSTSASINMSNYRTVVQPFNCWLYSIHKPNNRPNEMQEPYEHTQQVKVCVDDELCYFRNRRIVHAEKWCSKQSALGRKY